MRSNKWKSSNPSISKPSAHQEISKLTAPKTAGAKESSKLSASEPSLHGSPKEEYKTITFHTISMSAPTKSSKPSAFKSSALKTSTQQLWQRVHKHWHPHHWHNSSKGKLKIINVKIISMATPKSPKESSKTISIKTISTAAPKETSKSSASEW